MMSASDTPHASSGLGRPLLERERRGSQRAFIFMTVMLSITTIITAPNGVFGIYLKQLNVTGQQLGQLIAWATPCGIAGIFLAGLAVRIGRKRMIGWALVPTGLFIVALIVLPQIKEHWELAVMLSIAWMLLAAHKLSMSIMEVPWFPIIQMITLSNRRGTFLGRMRMVYSLICVIALLAIARLLGQEAPIEILILLIALAGILYWLMLIPLRYIVEHRSRTLPKAVSWAEAWRAAKASPLFVRGIAASASFWFGSSVFAVFQLFFLTKSMGWSDSAAIDVLWISMLGLAVSNIFWGAVADRLGDRAVAQLGFLGMAVSALFWLAAGNNGPLAQSMIFVGAFSSGIFRAGAMMSITRVILNHIPERVSPVLLAIRKLSVTLAMTAAAAMGSLVLKWLGGWRIVRSDNWLILDAYKVLFLIVIAVWLGSIWLCRKFPAVPGRTPWTVLAAMFNRPFQTVWLVSRIESALPEDDRLSLVHRLSHTDSPLAYDGLLAGLRDPSYDVRLASVNALASRSEPHCYKALLEVLDQPELDIQPEAAWALGELGDARAVPELIIALGSSSQLLRGRAARALGKLNAHQAVANLQRLLAEDPDSFVRRSTAIALSRLNIQESLGSIFKQFRQASTRLAQRELALALANLVHGGDLYYRVRRHETQGIATVLEETIDENLGDRDVGQQAQQCFAQMVEALRSKDLEQVRAIAAQAVQQDSLQRPVGNAGELFDYLLTTVQAEPWAEEHAALLVFLLLQEFKRHQGWVDYS